MIYTYQNLVDQVFDPLVYPNIGSTVTVLNIANRAVRMLLSKVDLRSTKRKATTAPVLFNDVFDYACPSDLKRMAIIDLAPQVNRNRTFELNLTTPEEFDRRKTFDTNLITISDQSGIRKVRASVNVNSKQLIISSLDSLTAGGGTWTAVGDAQNLTADADDFVKGAGSIRWDIGTGGTTTAGIKNTTLTPSDISDYINNNRSVFHFEKIIATANLTNWILELGSDSSNFYRITVTTTNEGTAFQVGWNLLRFDFVNKTTVGTPDMTNITYAAIYMTKAGAKISETGYRSDHLILEGGIIHDLFYYSKFGWQTSGGTWIELSSATTDLLNADTEEFELFVRETKIQAAIERKDYDVLPFWQQEQADAIQEYKMQYPSEAKVITNVRYDVFDFLPDTDLNDPWLNSSSTL